MMKKQKQNSRLDETLKKASEEAENHNKTEVIVDEELNTPPDKKTATDTTLTEIKVQRSPPNEKYSVWKMLRNTAIVTIILLLIWFFSPFEVMRTTTNGMEPALPDGSISIALKTSEKTEYKVGDIITFSADFNGIHYSSITQRIVAIDKDFITTKPDILPEDTQFIIKKDQIKNKIIIKNIFKKSPNDNLERG